MNNSAKWPRYCECGAMIIGNRRECTICDRRRRMTEHVDKYADRAAEVQAVEDQEHEERQRLERWLESKK